MQLQDITTMFVGNGANGNYGLMNRRDLFNNTSLTTTFINQAIMRIQRELRCPANEKWVEVTIGAGYTGLVIPNDYLELIGIYPQADWVTRTRPDRLERALNYAQFATDKPMMHSRQGGQWILGPAPAEGDVILLGYYSEFPALVNPTDQNILTIVGWDLILNAALSAACQYYNDKRQQQFEANYITILAQLNDMGADDELDEGRMEACHKWPDDDTDNYEIWVP